MRYWRKMSGQTDRHRYADRNTLQPSSWQSNQRVADFILRECNVCWTGKTVSGEAGRGDGECDEAFVWAASRESCTLWETASAAETSLQTRCSSSVTLVELVTSCVKLRHRFRVTGCTRVSKLRLVSFLNYSATKSFEIDAPCGLGQSPLIPSLPHLYSIF